MMPTSATIRLLKITVLAAVIYFGGGDRLAEFHFRLRFAEAAFFGG